MSDAKPRQTAILTRGEYLKPAEKVSFSTPSFLPPLPKDSPANRLGFARWLVAPEHPLDRSRAGQSHVATFLRDRHRQDLRRLRRAERVSDPWRAAGLAGRGVSRARLEHEGDAQADRHQCHLSSVEPGDSRSFAPATSRIACMRVEPVSDVVADPPRLGAGVLRVARSGGSAGPPVYPYQPDAIWEALAITKERDFTYPASSGNDLYRRSLYTFWRRTVSPANMFDASNRQTCRVRSTTTSTPLHALTTLNDPTWVEAATDARSAQYESLARSRCAGSLTPFAACSVASQPIEIWRYCDAPIASRPRFIRPNIEGARAFLGWAPPDETNRSTSPSTPRLSAVCLAILNLDEALTRE